MDQHKELLVYGVCACSEG